MYNDHEWILEQNSNYISLAKWQKTVDLMVRLYRAPAGYVVKQSDKGYQVMVASKQQNNPYAAGGMLPIDGNMFYADASGDVPHLYVPDISKEAQWKDSGMLEKSGFVSYLGMPILWPDGSQFGTLCVMDFSETHYQPEYLALFRQLRDMIQDDLALVDSFEKMREIAMLDPLTELYNRRAFFLLAEQQLRLANRMGFEVYCLYIDVNDFKQLNDEYGHEQGDKVLLALAETLRTVLRKTDITGRLGGDEFVAILQCQQDHMPERVIDKLQQEFEDNTRQLGSRADLSIGHAFREPSQSLRELLGSADQVMYERKMRAKREARN